MLVICKNVPPIFTDILESIYGLFSFDLRFFFNLDKNLQNTLILIYREAYITSIAVIKN